MSPWVKSGRGRWVISDYGTIRALGLQVWIFIDREGQSCKHHHKTASLAMQYHAPKSSGSTTREERRAILAESLAVYLERVTLARAELQELQNRVASIERELSMIRPLHAVAS